MHKAKSIVFDLLLLSIITIPAFLRILNNQYFSMHDDQHIVRLILLDQGLKQGNLYPRWVDGLGFGFGYPLYNFYPPLVYYVAEVFHLLGFSLIWSVKITFILGFFLGAFGIYLLVKKLTNRLSGFLSTALYTYFFYHAVLIYVRGALAEFFSLAILPFIFLTLDNLANKINWKNAIFFGVSMAILILCHPLIALPSLIFIGFLFLFYLLRSELKVRFVSLFIGGLFFGLLLSAFFWLPSFLERSYTLTDKILTGELASYKLHYIYLQQFIYSPWGYGGSGVGLSDGITFQLGKIHIGLVVGAVILSVIYYLTRLKRHSGDPDVTSGDSRIVVLSNDSGRVIIPSTDNRGTGMTLKFFYLFVLLLLFSLFMTTGYSSFIWDKVKYLWYLQFPWRFLTFTTIFISITGGYFIFFLSRSLQQFVTSDRWKKAMSHSRPVTKYGVNSSGNLFNSGFLIKSGMTLIGIVIITFTIFTYQKYFRPQRLLSVTDKELTSREEISWRISRTSYEFVPRGVKTKKSELNTTLLAIGREDLPKKPYEVLSGKGEVRVLKNTFQTKEFLIDAKTRFLFRLNTFNFPGWKAYLSPSVIPSERSESRNLKIDDKNDFKLITVNIPVGKNDLKFVFEDTGVRKIANLLSTVTFFTLIVLALVHRGRLDFWLTKKRS